MSIAEDPFSYGLAYLYQVRTWAAEPDLIDLIYQPTLRALICPWIGAHIQTLNAQLNQLLLACQNCFHPWQHRPIQILAAPFADAFGIDGCCNLAASPTTLLVDVGRVLPQDWLALVAHEYAHAHLAVPGHSSQFGQTLTHLCLGLDLPLPSRPLDAPLDWRSLPPYRQTHHPIAFWLGQSGYPLAHPQRFDLKPLLP